MRNGSTRRRNFAFVTFVSDKSATRAVEEGEITVEYATLKIERALERQRIAPTDKTGGRSEFE